MPQNPGFSGLVRTPFDAIMAAIISPFRRTSMHIIQTTGFWPGRCLALSFAFPAR